MVYKKDQYIGTLLGCAIGDSLGMPVETWKPEQIRKYHGRIERLVAPIPPTDKDGKVVSKDEYGKIRPIRDFKKGEYTDDTILTLALAESIIEMKGLDLNHIAKTQLEAFQARRQNGGFGWTTKTAFEKLEQSESPLTTGLHEGIGNAPPMKMSPIGLYMDSTGDVDGGIEYARRISEMSHLDPRAVAAGILQARMIYELLQDNYTSQYSDKFMEKIMNQVKEHELKLTSKNSFIEEGRLQDKLQWINSHKYAPDAEAYEILGNSSKSLESYPFTIFMFQKYWNEPITGLLETINYGGDCDTTGAMFGALAGAKHGMFFSKDWIRDLKDSDTIIEVADKFYNTKLYKVLRFPK